MHQARSAVYVRREPNDFSRTDLDHEDEAVGSSRSAFAPRQEPDVYRPDTRILVAATTPRWLRRAVRRARVLVPLALLHALIFFLLALALVIELSEPRPLPCSPGAVASASPANARPTTLANARPTLPLAAPARCRGGATRATVGASTSAR